MANWATLDVAIGLAVVYFILSLLASTINEAISTWRGWRSKFLEQWLVNVLEEQAKQPSGTSLLDKFWDHPLISPLTRQPKGMDARRTHRRRPSYISTETFSAVILNLDAAAHTGKRTVDDVIAGLPPDTDLGRAVISLRTEVGDDLSALRVRLERWYDDGMERVSGWYKRHVQLWLAVIGLALAIVVNADTLQLVNSLWGDKTVRAAVVAEAGRTVQNGKPTSLGDTAGEVQRIKALNVPLGWKLKRHDPRDLPHGFRSWFAKVLGLLLTAVALTLGAPFWFDLLSKMVRVRGSGAPPPARDAVRSGDGEQRRAGPQTVS
jgi:hypothetical protein